MPTKYHTWYCDCGKVIEAIGPMALTLEVTAHDRQEHGRVQTWQIEDILTDKRYVRPEGCTPYDPRTPVAGPQRQYLLPHGTTSKGFSAQDISYLGLLRISLDEDTRSPEELSARYRNKVQ
jgi:hypothetical protein